VVRCPRARLPASAALVRALAVINLPRAFLDERIERQLLTTGIWAPPVNGVLDAYLAPGGTFVDVGANIGYFTLVGSLLVGDRGTVIAVEPSTRDLRKLTHHLTLNPCANVTVLSVGAGEADGLQELSWATETNI
jgi:hypothetical protein